MRTMKAALESHIGIQLPCTHPIVRWLVQNSADVVNKSAVNRSGHAHYEDLHGKKPKERRIEFGERVFYSIPKQGRAKMDVRWKLGVFLGHTPASGEHFVGARNGNVLKARSCVRVVEPSRWDRDALDRIVGIPGAVKPAEDGEPTPDDVEGVDNPQVFAEHEVDPEQRERQNKSQSARPPERDVPPPAPPVPSGPKRVRITRKDLDKYGTTPGCPRCADLDYGNHRTKKAHDEACRKRFYDLFKAADNAKWSQAAHDLQRRISRGGDLSQTHELSFITCGLGPSGCRTSSF